MPFLQLICIILPFRSPHMALRKEAGLEATILTETAAQLIFKFFYLLKP